MRHHAFPTLACLVNGPVSLVPLNHLPGWYAIVIPAGRAAQIFAPYQAQNGQLPGRSGLTRDQLTIALGAAAASDVTWVTEGGWSIRTTRGGWQLLEPFKDVVVDLLSATSLLPVEPGLPNYRDRARVFARKVMRRLLARPAERGEPASPEDVPAEEPTAPQPAERVVQVFPARSTSPARVNGEAHPSASVVASESVPIPDE